MRYTFYSDKRASWTIEKTDAILRAQLMRICLKICDVLLTVGDDTHPLILSYLVPFARSVSEKQNIISIPEKIVKDVERSIIDDNENHMVAGWRLINDVLEQTHKANTSIANEDVRQGCALEAAWDEHQRIRKFRDNVPM